MLTSRRLGFGAALTAILFVLGCTGAAGPKGDPGPAGDTGAKGDTGDAGKDGKDGTTPALTNDVTGTVSDANGPLAGVAVTASPGAKTAITDANGKFTLSALDIGVYDVMFELAGYVDQTVKIGVNLSGPTTVNVTLAVDLNSGTPPTIALTDQLNAGFGKPVTLKATVSQGKAPYKYSWAQTSGPAVAISGGSTDTISFTTQALTSAIPAQKLANARFGVMGINPNEAGAYVFEVTVTDNDGRVSKGDVKVDATRPSPGLRMVPIGIPVWLQGDGALVNAKQTTWSWTMDTSGAAGSTATINNPTSQFPSFTPDVKGVYKVTETVANKTMTIYVGTWMGEMTADGSPPANTCGLCHTGNIAPATFDEWKDTRHFKGLADKLDGVTTQYFAEECMSCHTVGYDKTASNGGFDDLAPTSGWSMPGSMQMGNWSSLVNNTTLGPLAGIQCENCHGPQAQPSGGPHTSSKGAVDDHMARVSWSTDVCASCHQETPHHYKPSQWWSSKHGDLELAYVDATIETRHTTAAHCGRCHTAQGYARYAEQLVKGYTGNLTKNGDLVTPADETWLGDIGLKQATVQSQTCQSCHDPHNAKNPAQLRIYDGAPGGLPNGMGPISGLGSGMVCASCHNTRNGEHSDFVTTAMSYTAPHVAAQTDVVFGFNSYFMPRYNPSAHLAVKDTCAGCHYGIATAEEQAAKQATNHSFMVDTSICAACHSSNVDGKAFQAAYQNNLDALGQAIAGKIMKVINNALAADNEYYIRAWDPTSDEYSSLTPPSSSTPTVSNIKLQVAPTLIEHEEIHGQIGFKLTFANAIQIQFVKPDGTPDALVTSKVLYVQAGNLRSLAKKDTGPDGLFLRSSDYTRALWNYYLLHSDGTKGVHNPNFYNDLIAVTNTKVAALP